MPAADRPVAAPAPLLQERVPRMNYRPGAAKRAAPPEPTT